MTDDIVSADSEDGQRLGETIIEIVENQLEENNPPETRITLDRLIAEGETRENAMRHIASALVIEIFGMLKHQELFNEKRYIKNLNGLPNTPEELL